MPVHCALILRVDLDAHACPFCQVCALPSLRYLHVACPMYPRIPNIKDALAARLPPSIELFGYDADLHWVAPDTRGSPVLAPPWPLSKVYLRTVDDFRGEEDWEWLLRQHGHFGPESDSAVIRYRALFVRGVSTKGALLSGSFADFSPEILRA